MKEKVDSPVIKLTVGLPASGKSSFVQKAYMEEALKQMSVILTLDEFLINIYGSYDLNSQNILQHRERVKIVRHFFLSTIRDFSSYNFVYFIDDGFFTKETRKWYIGEIRSILSECKIELHYLKCTKKEMIKRVNLRNCNLPKGNFYIEPTMLNQMFELFEPPTEEECKSLDVDLFTHDYN
jgi:AAA domain